MFSQYRDFIAIKCINLFYLILLTGMAHTPTHKCLYNRVLICITVVYSLLAFSQWTHLEFLKINNIMSPVWAYQIFNVNNKENPNMWPSTCECAECIIKCATRTVKSNYVDIAPNPLLGGFASRTKSAISSADDTRSWRNRILWPEPAAASADRARWTKS